MMIDINYILIVLGVILISMTLHEAMHGFVAYYLGDDTAKAEGRLTLNPIKHIDPFLTIILPLSLALVGAPIFGGAKPVPFNPSMVRHGEWGVALVALAGPLTNFLIAFVSFGLLVVVERSSAYGLVHAFGISTTISDIGTILVISVFVNLGFFIFNMLPIPPLDGSRFMYALAPEFVRRGMEAIERFGVIVIFMLVLVASPLIGGMMNAFMSSIFRLFGLIFGL